MLPKKSLLLTKQSRNTIGGEPTVTIITKNGKEEFDKRIIENKLKSAGLSVRLAQEVADRVSDKVEEGWTVEKVMQQTSDELRSLYESVEKVYEKFNCSVPMGDHNVGEQRISENEDMPNGKPITESRVEFKNVET